ncbi:MAG: ABC transporter ATP-binding protein [Acetivibrionales bacterium]
MEKKEKLFEVKNLVVKYTSAGAVSHAVNNISFSINEGETLGIVGETGAGKTTTAFSILRILPNMGRVSHMSADYIKFQGKNLLELKEAEMRSIRGALISMIFQDPMTSLNPVLTVGEQIAEAIRLHNPDMNEAEVQEEVDKMLKLVNIEPDRKHEYPHQFSGGMKQRVVIAIALSCKPKLIIADEPTTALDVTIQAQVLALIAELRRKLNTSMILITHDLGVVAETCDKVAVMYAGEIVESGSIHEIFEGEHHHPYTIGLFGSIPLLDIEVERLSPIDGLMPDPTDLPEGCKFSPRCPYSNEECKKQQPQKYIKDNHIIRCRLMKGIYEVAQPEAEGEIY